MLIKVKEILRENPSIKGKGIATIKDCLSFILLKSMKLRPHDDD
jgi:hypothetical protein